MDRDPTEYENHFGLNLDPSSTILKLKIHLLTSDNHGMYVMHIKELKPIFFLQLTPPPPSHQQLPSFTVCSKNQIPLPSATPIFYCL